MPGFVGIAGSRSWNPGLLEAMIQPMLYRSGYAICRRREETCLMAAVDLDRQGQSGESESADGRFVLIFSGTFFEPWLNSGVPVAVQLLKRWSELGEQGLTNLNGKYFIAVWERAEERLTLVNDRLGLKVLNLWQDGQSLAWASSMQSLAVIPQVSRRVDPQALSELLMFGHLQEDRTLLADVKLLPPASILTWQKGRTEIRRYWEFAYRSNPSFKNPETASEAFAEHLERAVDRRLEKGKAAGLLLSGGLDSRALAGMIRKLSPAEKIYSWTCGHGHDHDSRFGRQIARSIGSVHEEVRVPQDYLNRYGAFYSRLVNGTAGADGAHRAVLMESVKGRPEMIFNGFLGDVLSGSNLLAKTANAPDIEKVINTGFDYYTDGLGEALAESFLKPEIFRETRGLARETFAGAVRSSRSETLPDRLGLNTLRFHLWGESRAQLDVLECEAQVRTPFIDNDFVDFILQLPLDQRIERRAYVNMIIRKFPRLAAVPRSGDGLPLKHSRLRGSLHWKSVLFKRNVLTKWSRGLYRPHSYDLYVHCHEWFRTASRSFIQSEILGDSQAAEFFRREALSRFIGDFLDKGLPVDGWKAIGRLIGFFSFWNGLNRVPVFREIEKKESAVHSD